jgi:hypothetical protein
LAFASTVLLVSETKLPTAKVTRLMFGKQTVASDSVNFPIYRTLNRVRLEVHAPNRPIFQNVNKSFHFFSMQLLVLAFNIVAQAAL